MADEAHSVSETQPNDGDATEVEPRLALARARLHGWPHAADEVAIRRQLARSVARASALRRVPLTNGDEPDFVFVPFRADDRGGGV